MDDDEPVLLLANHERDGIKLMLPDKRNMMPKLVLNNKSNQTDSNLLYLDNGVEIEMCSSFVM